MLKYCKSCIPLATAATTTCTTRRTITSSSSSTPATATESYSVRHVRMVGLSAVGKYRGMQEARIGSSLLTGVCTPSS